MAPKTSAQLKLPGSASAHQTWLCMRTSDGVTPEEDPTSLKTAKLESANWEGPDTGPRPREPLTRYRGPCTKGSLKSGWDF